MKKKFAVLLTVCLIGVNLTGYNYYKETKQSAVGIALQEMDILAEVSILADSKIISRNTNNTSIEISFENGLTFRQNFYGAQENNKEIGIECTFEDSKEAIENKMSDYIKFGISNNLNPEQLSNIKDALLTTGQYEMEINGCSHSAKYTEGWLSFSVK